MTKQKQICRQRKELVVARGERVGGEATTTKTDEGN